MISKTKRSLTLVMAAAALTFAIPSAYAQAPRVIKISHQFPAATTEDGDSATDGSAALRLKSRSRPREPEVRDLPGQFVDENQSQIRALRKSALA